MSNFTGSEWWDGFWTSIGLVILVFIALGLFNIDRPRVLDYKFEQKECIVRNGHVERCYGAEKGEEATPVP